MTVNLQEKKAFDLTALADEFERRKNAGDNRFERYRVLIEEFEAACSILKDLRAAEASIEALNDIQDNPDLRIRFGQALITHAVLCYCRATVSETNARRRINIDKKAYTPDLFKRHLDIKDLRSTALAHYHKGLGRHGDIWVSDRVVMRPVEGHVSSIDVFRRTNFLAAAANDLYELLGAAITYVASERLRRKAALDEAITSALTKDQAFIHRLEDHSFDPDDFFAGLREDTSDFWQDIATASEAYRPSADHAAGRIQRESDRG